jgi:AcrR family transcriptional regulator
MNTGSSIRRLRHREADLAGLLQAAERVFSDRGYHATSIRDIAREAGFSVGGVYQFFASKDELYLRVVEEQWDHFFTLLNDALTADTTERRLLGLTEGMFRAFEERRGFFKLFLSERGRLSAAFTGEIAQRVGERTRKLRALIVDLMRTGVQEGLLQPVPPDMLASAFMGIVHNCIFEAMASGAQRPGRPATAVLALFLHGAAREHPAPGAVTPPRHQEHQDQP